MPLSLSLPSSRTTYIIISLLPVAIPTAYLLLLKARTSQRVTSVSGTRHPLPPPPTGTSWTPPLPPPAHPASLPSAVAAPPSPHTLSYERVASRPVPAALLLHPCGSPALLTAYARACMKAFARTPQAWLMRAMFRGPAFRRSFADEYVDGAGFEEGEVLCGVYCVAHREGGERVEMVMRVPEGYAGPVVHGLIVVGMEVVREGDGDGDGEVAMVNETWMWRGPEEKPTMLESLVGRWLHTLLAGWLIGKGIAAVTKKEKVKDV